MVSGHSIISLLEWLLEVCHLISLMLFWHWNAGHFITCAGISGSFHTTHRILGCSRRLCFRDFYFLTRRWSSMFCTQGLTNVKEEKKQRFINESYQHNEKKKKQLGKFPRMLWLDKHRMEHIFPLIHELQFCDNSYKKLRHEQEAKEIILMTGTLKQIVGICLWTERRIISRILVRCGF